MKNIFTDHPNEVGESYIKHFGHALSFCFLLLGLSFKALVHAIFPFWYKTAVSDRIKKLSKDMQARRKNSKEES